MKLWKSKPPRRPSATGVGGQTPSRARILYDANGDPVSSVPSAISTRTVDTDKGFAVLKRQVVDDTIDAVSRLEMPRRPKGDGVRYVGSVPLLINQIWAKECGAPVGSKEFLVYAHKKLQDREFRKFLARLQ